MGGGSFYTNVEKEAATKGKCQSRFLSETLATLRPGEVNILQPVKDQVNCLMSDTGPDECSM